MTVPGYLLAIALLGAFAVPPAVAALTLRRRFAPDLEGAPAALGAVVGWVAIVVVTSELLGSVGLFRAWALVLGSLAVSAAIVAKWGRPRRAARLRIKWNRETAVAFGAAVLVLGQWAVPTRVSLGQGMLAPDTLWYHMPFAARFVQDGWLTHLHFVEVEPLTAFYPQNSELLHAIGIALFDSRDVLSPFVNEAMAALALLAGWCIGRRWNVAALSMAGVAVALSVEIVWGINAGQAGNDATGLAFFLAAAALLANAAPAFAGAAAGLALGTKFSLVGPALALTAVALVIDRRHAWRWLIPMLATGSFWYLRNLFDAGSPLPTVSLHLGPIDYAAAPRPLTDHLEFSLAHYLFHTDVWSSHLRPGLRFGFGPVWWALIALAALGAVGALLRRGDRLRTALGGVAIACAVLYAVTPNSAAGRDGDPWSFGLNLRYALPALALGLALPPTWLRHRRVVLAVLVTALVLTILSKTGLPSGRRLEAAGWAAAIAAAAAMARRRPVLIAAAAVVLFFPVQRHYLAHRYDELPPTFEFARHISHSRIGVLGATTHYQLYGKGKLDNRVLYVGIRGPHGAFTRATSCEQWRNAVNAGDFRYLIVAPVQSPDLPAETPTSPPREASWTDATPIYRFRNLVTVYRIDRPLDPRGCP